MNDDGFNVRELDIYEREILRLAQRELPRETKKFLRTEGNKLRKATLKKAKSKTTKKTGNYYKGIKRGKVYQYSGNNGLSVRVYGGKPSHHAHLIEYGHVIRKQEGGPELGFVPGLHVFEEAREEFTPIFAKDVEDFIDEMTENLWWDC